MAARPGLVDLLDGVTPVGTAPRSDETPLPGGYMCHRGKIVYDLVYNPPQTKLLAGAAEAGCRTIGGLDMLVAQAQAQFEWWTGQRAADAVMRDAAMARLHQATKVDERRSPKGEGGRRREREGRL